MTTDRKGNSPASDRKGLFVVYALLGIGLVAAGYLFRADLARMLFKLEAVIGILGPAAPIALALICGIWGALCLPGPLMQGTVATLFASDPPIALGIVMAGETIAMSTAFAIGRSLGRERVRHRLEGKPWFAKLESEVKKKGFVGVFIFRLMPFFPNALGSYAFGLTALRFPAYIVPSVIGSLPKMVLYIYGTTSVVGLLRQGVVSSTTLLGISAAIVAVALLGRRLQVALKTRQS